MAAILPVNGPIATESCQDGTLSAVDAVYIQQRTFEERNKRLRDDADSQYIDLLLSDKFKHFADDLYVDPASVRDICDIFPDDRCHLLVVGAGLGGLQGACRMLQAGVPVEDIRMVDTAGGFGGTWYFNRYPGLKCDVESYCYLPLLEDTKYIPKHRYSYGPEIRAYANLLAKRFKLDQGAAFCTKVEHMAWDESAKEWQVEVAQIIVGRPTQRKSIRSKFVITCNGVFSTPKLPDLPGVLEYKGLTFHSSRWDYSVTGGSDNDINPSLDKLKGKRVAIIGTGCTSVQIIGHVAKWAEHLYVVQRTPASVDHREQSAVHEKTFLETIATSPGWQRERLRNFHAFFTSGRVPKVDVVNDSWTDARSMCVISGNPCAPMRTSDMPAYMEALSVMDTPRTQRIRALVDSQVKDADTADKLKAWYPTWCKRPAFQDDYYPVFNRDNVTLIDTGGKDIDRITTDSIVFEGQSYPVDLIIFATGFSAPFKGSPAHKANATILGRGGVSMAETWALQGPSTIHGVLDRDFPNLFLSGPWQAAASPSLLFAVDQLMIHAAYIYATAKRKAGNRPFSVAPTHDAAEAWAGEIISRSLGMAAMIGCTPGYFSLDGALERAPPEALPIIARSSLWGLGIEDYLEHIEAWRKEGGMQGIEVCID